MHEAHSLVGVFCAYRVSQSLFKSRSPEQPVSSSTLENGKPFRDICISMLYGSNYRYHGDNDVATLPSLVLLVIQLKKTVGSISKKFRESL